MGIKGHKHIYNEQAKQSSLKLEDKKDIVCYFKDNRTVAYEALNVSRIGKGGNAY